MDASDCPACGTFVECSSCLTAPGLQCQWAIDTCQPLGTYAGIAPILNSTNCAAPCNVRGDCSSCTAYDPTGQALQCGWCDSSQSCFDFGLYTATDSLGQCSAWFRPAGAGNTCLNCAAATNCGDCLATPSCGWCYSTVIIVAADVNVVFCFPLSIISSFCLRLGFFFLCFFFFY